MAAILLILRPQPGADATAARALENGLEAHVAPLFTIRPVDWDPDVPVDVDSVMLTSASAARQAGPQLTRFITLPCYAVGEATGAVAERAGFSEIRTGPADGVALLEMAARQGIRQPLHLCGKDHIPLEHPRLTIIRRIVYAADPVARLPAEAIEALGGGALALLHSPRAAGLFASLVDQAGLDRASIRIAAISEAAAEAAGRGWKSTHSAAAPRDDALLELAAKLCKNEVVDTGKAE